MGRIVSIRWAGKSRKLVQAGVFAAAVLMCSGAGLAQQRNNIPPPSRPNFPPMDPFNMPRDGYGDPMRAKQDAKRLAYMNAERQKALVAQTNRLVKLASELHAQINGDQHTLLTPDQIRQLQEIEKLAKNIKDKMSASLLPAPAFDSGPPFMGR